MKRFALQFAVLLAGSALTLSASNVQVTLSEFSGAFITSGFPASSVAVGTFVYSLPVGEQIVSASFSSTFGNSVVPSSAGVNVYVGGILVGTCLENDPCDTTLTTITPFNYAFQPSDFATLSSGSLDVTAIQTGGNYIRLGAETLNITTAALDGVPEPATFGLFGLGATALGLFEFRRRRSQ
jgi:hypothetical protein